MDKLQQDKEDQAVRLAMLDFRDKLRETAHAIQQAASDMSQEDLGCQMVAICMDLREAMFGNAVKFLEMHTHDD